MEKEIKEVDAIAFEEDEGRKEVEVEEILKGEGVLLHNLLSEEECQKIIDEFERLGPQQVTLNRAVRNCQRLQLDLPLVAELIWKRAASHLPSALKERHVPEEEARKTFGYHSAGTWKSDGLNEKFRLCRYLPGGHFGPHCDGAYVPHADHRSLLTFMIYLNGKESFKGGRTNFLEDSALLKESKNPLTGEAIYAALPEQVKDYVEPRTGTAIVFWQQYILHEGQPLTDGQKYIMRTDVMFKRDKASKPKLTEAQDQARELLALAQRLEGMNNFTEAAKLYSRAYKLDPELEGM